MGETRLGKRNLRMLALVYLMLNLVSWFGMKPMHILANSLGTTEPALKLLISIIITYLYALLYHEKFNDLQKHKNKYFILLGLDLAIFNFGLSFIYNLVPVLIFYMSTLQFGPTKTNAYLTVVFNMSYLLYGYIMTESEDYDITWTMPHCVLTLKLIALSFDLCDGQKMLKGETLSENCKKSAVTIDPSLLDLLGFIYFPACFLIGPLFSFRRYKDYICDKFPVKTERRVITQDALIRLCQGFLYLIAFQIGGNIYSMEYMMSEKFLECNIFYRHFYCGMWAHFALYKYISCWLIAEAACIQFGLSYNGVGENKRSKWDGCTNIKLLKFEAATKFQHYIDSFNCNTNHFAAEYIYKRLKFLGNRNMSQVLTLLFLALWHGTRSGYIATFFNEFIIIIMEKDIESILSKTEIYHRVWANMFGKIALYVFLKMYTIVFMGWSLVPFDLLIFSKWFSVYKSLYFSGFIIFLPWAFLYKKGFITLLKKLELKLEVKRQ